MTGFEIVPLRGQLAKIGITGIPTVILDAGEKATWRFIEFFTANIRNRNTREAYARAVVRFCTWCEKKHLLLGEVRPFYIAAYIEELGATLSRPSVKQHLAAIRMLFNWLVNFCVLVLSYLVNTEDLGEIHSFNLESWRERLFHDFPDEILHKINKYTKTHPLPGPTH